MRKIIAILLATLLVLSLCSCGSEETGKIDDMPAKSGDAGAVNTVKSGSTQFIPQNTKLDYKWKNAEIGRAKLSLPYPSGWSMSKKTDYDISFVAPQDDKYFPGQTVTFHSTLEMEQIVDIHDLETRFEQQLQLDKYYCDGTYLMLSPSSSIERYVVNTKVSDPNDNLQLSTMDEDVSLLVRGNKEPNREFYHQATYFFWCGFPCVLSGVTEHDSSDELNDLLIYMMSNSKEIESELKSLSPVTLFNSTSEMTFPMSNIYMRKEADPGELFSSAEGFVCPSDTGTGYSQSALVVFETETDKFHMTSNTFEGAYKDHILQNIFGLSVSKLRLSGYMKYDDGYVDFNGTRAKEYVYCMTVGSTGDLPDGYYYGQQWDLILYPIEHEDVTDLVCICAPTDGMIWAFDNIVNMAKKLTYK